MKRSGPPLENEEKNKRARKLYKKNKANHVNNGLFLEVTTNGTKIMPRERRKYTGSISYRKDKARWASVFQGKYNHLSIYSHKTEEDAVTYLKKMNVTHNLKVKNVLFLYHDEYYCVLTQEQVMRFSIGHIDVVENHTWQARYDAVLDNFYVTAASPKPGNHSHIYYFIALYFPE